MLPPAPPVPGVPLPPTLTPPEPPRRDLRPALITILSLLLALSLIGNLLLAGNLHQANRRADRAAGVTPPATASPDPGGTSTPGGDDLSAVVRAIQGQTAAVRELEFVRDLEPEFLTEAELAEDLESAIPDEDLEAGLPDEAVLHALGILPEGMGLLDTLRAAAEGNILGYYDPETERLVVRSEGGELSPLAKVALSHELTHAVTDQRFDLERLLTGDEPDDVALGGLGLIEGDATLEMQLWAAEYLSLQEQIELGVEAAAGLLSSAQLPPALEALQAFPYVEGMTFVQSLYDRGGWEAVNDAYADPPTSSEQILHPETYVAGETGEDISVDASLPGYTRFDRGEVGEFFLRTLLEGSGVSAPSAAADGWDGGGYEGLRGPDGVLVSIALRWDSADEDAEFEAALRAASIGGCVEVDPAGPTDTRFTVYPGTCPA